MSYDFDRHIREHREFVAERMRATLIVDLLLAFVLGIALTAGAVWYFGYPCLDRACVGAKCACLQEGPLDPRRAAVVIGAGVVIGIPLLFTSFRGWRRRGLMKWDG